jgi:serine/threonine protein kinase
MICCLNPHCTKPLNPDNVTTCQSCGASLTPLLRGRYRPLEPLGQGGFGKTYLAADEDRLGARCVIKQFSPNIQGTKSLDKAISLFNQEAVRLYELGEHPQIPTLFAYFEQDGYLYLVQQYIEGQSLLSQMKKEGAFSERQIREVLSDVLPVLRFVHKHQVIHRDVTPMNILRRNEDQRLILIDFGVAKQINEAVGDAAGTRIGTEGYAPMEQFRGGRVFPASDIYSLGATCLHLMTDAKPDSMYDPLEGRWFWRDFLQKKGILVSDQLAHILDTMLKDLVGDRYQSVEEVMRDLNADYFLPQSPKTGSGNSFTGRSATPAPAAKPTPSPSPGFVTSKPPVSNPQSLNPAVSQPPTSRPPTSRPPISQPPTSNPPVSTPGAAGTAPMVQPGEGRCSYTLFGHSSWITSVAIASSNPILASGSLDDTVKLWNLAQGDLIATLVGHNRGVNAIAISPSGPTLTSGSDDYTLKTWNMRTGALLRTMTGHSRDVNAVVISANGQILATGAEDRTIRLWQMGTGNLLKTLLGAGSMIKALATSPDCKLLVSGGFDHKIKIWSLQTGEELKTLSGHMNVVNALAVTPDNQILVSGSKDKTIKLWNLRTGEMIRTLSDHIRDVNAIAISPNGKTIISGSSDNTIKLWNLSTGELLDTLSGHMDSVNSIAISPDGTTLASGSSDKTIKVWKL